MHGEYRVRVRNSRNSYAFSLRRNITVLRGESGRGKTTLFDMIHEHNRFGKESGVSISCDKELVAIDGDKWEDDILSNPGKIIVIDEDSHFIKSKDFCSSCSMPFKESRTIFAKGVSLSISLSSFPYTIVSL